MPVRFARRAIKFITSDVWRIRTATLTPPKSWLIRHLRVFLLSCRGFYDDRCSLRASALTFYTLLSLVPVAAMTFGVAKGFGFKEKLEQMVLERMAVPTDAEGQVVLKPMVLPDGEDKAVPAPTVVPSDSENGAVPEPTAAPPSSEKAAAPEPMATPPDSEKGPPTEPIAAPADSEKEALPKPMADLPAGNGRGAPDPATARLDIARYIIDFSNKLLDNAKGGVVAGIGLAVLIWTVLRVLSNIENAFNHIWGVRKARSVARKFGDYFATMLLCPILAILAGSVTVYVETWIIKISEHAGAGVAFLQKAGLKTLPMMIVWGMLTFIYWLMPNTKVRFFSALVAGVIAGTIYQIVWWLYLASQLGISKYNAIYGSFAALPFFLVLLQLSWLIVLFGAEISFAYQNVDTYEFEPDCRRASLSFKRLLGLKIMTRLVRDFGDGAPPKQAKDICHELEIPIRLGREVLFDLASAGLVSEVTTNGDDDVRYQPARDPGKLTISYVLGALEDDGQDNIPVHDSPELRKLSAALVELRDEQAASSANLLLRDV